MVFWFAMLATCFLAAELSVTRKLSALDFKLPNYCVPWGVLSVIFPNLFLFYAAGAIQASIIATGTCALCGTVMAEAYEPLTVENCHVALSKLPLQHLERRSFGAEGGLPTSHMSSIGSSKGAL
jgi:hypothetical protein